MRRNREESIQSVNQGTDGSKNINDTTTSLKSLKEYSLPISLSPKEGYPRSPEGAIKLTEMPKSLIPIFKFLSDSYDKNLLDAAKLPKDRNVSIFIVRVYLLSGQDELYLCTFLNNTIVDWLEIYSEGEAEYGALYITSFSIASNYEISVKTALYPEPSNRGNEIDATQNNYIISDEGKFVKK
ncbi:MAG: hypothetical protein LBH25_07975 [Fibromonadaceae bacterium]|nr:hypothetical protein [Fibromonadaceae bacterium]